MRSAETGGFLHAAAHVVAAVALLGLIDNFVRLIAAEAGLWQFHITRSAMVAVVLWLGARLIGWRLWPRRPGWVAVRSAVLSGAMMIYFAALAFMPIAQVAAGLFTSPIFVLILSVLVLRERVGPWRIAAVALGFLGVLLVLEPWKSGLSALALMPVAAGALYAVQALVTRHRCAEETTMSLQAGFFAAVAAWGLLGAGFVHLALPEPGTGFASRGLVAPTPAFWLWTTVQALGSLAALALLTRGYQMAEPSRLAVFEYSFLGFASLWAWVLWGEALSSLGYAGLALIAVAGAVISLRSGLPEAAARKAAAP